MIRIGEASKILGVTPQTTRKYVREGKLKAYHTGGNQLLFEPHDLNTFIGKEEPTPPQEQHIAYYIRSSSGQKASLTTQEQHLRTHAPAPDKIYTDKCSGLKDQRPALTRLMNDAQQGKITHIYITHKDRLTRFGYHYLEAYFTQNNVAIHVLDADEKKTLEEELLQDFMNLIASFSGKFYRLRGHAQQRKLLATAEQELKKRDSATEL